MPEELISATAPGFDRSEGIFYLALFIAGAIATFVRACRDGRRYNFGNLFGRCAQGGLIACGAIAIWLGSSGHVTVSGYLYLVAASFIGFFNHEIQVQLLEPCFDMAIKFVMDKAKRFFGMPTNGKRTEERLANEVGDGERERSEIDSKRSGTDS